MSVLQLRRNASIVERRLSSSSSSALKGPHSWHRTRRTSNVALRRRQLHFLALVEEQGKTIELASVETEGEDHQQQRQASTRELHKLFQSADQDGNGVLDRQELRALLESTNSGLESQLCGWLPEEEVDAMLLLFDKDGSGDIDFDEFCNIVNDGMLLAGKLEEYRRVFNEADTSGNGTLGALELEDLFARLGNPLNADKLFKLMEQYDTDQSGQIEFNEFLAMFRSELLELQDLLAYFRMNPRKDRPPDVPKLIEPVRGRVNQIYSEEEFDAVLTDHRTRLVVVKASLTWCRPCKGFARAYERFADYYKEAIFLQFFGNASESTKYLFRNRLKTPLTPGFNFFREGRPVYEFQGASKAKMQAALQQHLLEAENPLAHATPFQRQVWEAKLVGNS